MTTPNLPFGSTTQADLAQGVVMPSGLGSAWQDQSKAKYLSLASGRFPAPVRGTSAGSPAVSAGPLGFVVDLVAQFMSTVGNADPASIKRPEDLYGLVEDFVSDLPLVGELIDLKDAMLGEYTGDDPIFLFIQDLFAPLRKLLQLASGQSGIPTVGELTSGWSSLWDDIQADFGELLAALRGEYVGGDPVLSGIQVATLPLRILLDPMGTIRPWLLPTIGVGQITDSQTNLVGEGDFAAAVTIDAGESGYRWDPDHGYGDVLGCAAVDGDGVAHSLTMTSTIPVAVGQKLKVGARVSWQWVTGPVPAGARLLLATYSARVPVSTVSVTTIDVTGTQPVWQQIEGEWTVPAGVDSVAVVLSVPAALADGTVRFDRVTVYKTQKLQLGWVEGLVQRFTALAALFGITDVDLDGDIDVADVWNALWHGILKALNWIPTVAQSTIDQIINAFSNVGALIDSNLPAGGILDAIFGIFDTGLTANNRISAFEARLRSVESAANTILDSFDGAGANSLGGSWAQTYFGGGAGSLGLDGKGNAVWRPSGAGNRTCIARYSASALTVDNCYIQVQLSSSPQSYVFDDAYTYICWRMNAGDTYGRLRIGFDEIRVQKVVSGAVSTIGSPVSVSAKGGNVIEVYVGAAGSPGRVRVLRNGVTLCDVVDGSPVYGSGYRSVGIGMETGNRLVITQNIPAGISVFQAAEVL